MSEAETSMLRWAERQRRWRIALTVTVPLVFGFALAAAYLVPGRPAFMGPEVAGMPLVVTWWSVGALPSGFVTALLEPRVHRWLVRQKAESLGRRFGVDPGSLADLVVS